MNSEAQPGFSLGSRKSEYRFFIRALLERRTPQTWQRLALLIGLSIGVGWIAREFQFLLLVLCAGGMYAVWRLWPIKAVLYDRGMTYCDRKGIRQVSWDQIGQVWRAVPHDNGLGKFVLHTKDGEQLELSFTLFNYHELGKAIEEGVHSVLLPKYLATIQSGQRVSFGRLALDNTGIYLGQEHLLWDEVGSVRTQPPRILLFTAEGTTPVVHIKKKQALLAWASLKEEQIPNVYTFYVLVSRFTEGGWTSD